MTILESTEEIRAKAKEFGRYRYVAEKSGVSYEWLSKFAAGSIVNPTVENVHKLELFFNQKRRATDADHARRATDAMHRRASDAEHNRRSSDHAL